MGFKASTSYKSVVNKYFGHEHRIDKKPFEKGYF